MKKLTVTEYRFMEYIWKHPEGVLSQDIYREFPQALGTKSVILHNIKVKGYVQMEQRGKQTIYMALIDKKEYDKGMMDEKVRKKTGMASVGALVASLCGKEELTPEQAKELYDFIERIKDDNNE